jgi:CspA family cold shock protein
MPLIGSQPAALFAFLAVTAAVALNLTLNLRQNRAYSPAEPQDLGDRETGTVKWFNTSKGFGFISRDSGDDIFVHFRAIRGEGHRVLVEGQRVEFAVMQRDKGLQAEDVIAALPSRR